MKISNPEKPLNPAIEVSKIDMICTKVAPYLIGLFSIILLVLAFYIFVVHGANITGTEANAFYNQLEVMV